MRMSNQSAETPVPGFTHIVSTRASSHGCIMYVPQGGGVGWCDVTHPDRWHCTIISGWCLDSTK